MNFHPSLLLRRALQLDAVASGATGALAFTGAGLLYQFLALPAPLLRYAGLILIPYAVFVGWLGLRERVSSGAVWSVIVINALWTLASIVLLVSGAVAPNLLGYAFVIGQALVVGVFAELQYFGLKKSAALLA